jgi:LacI family transcriptional regulator
MDRKTSPFRPVTVADVARRAEVSKATAARVLGGYGPVSEEVKLRVQAAAKALDYRPNELARSMSTGKSGTIGIVVGDIENAFFGMAVRSISDTAHRHGFNVILANSGEEVEAEKAALKVLIGKRVDGLIVTPADNRNVAHLRDIVRSRRPLVLFDRPIDGLAADVVATDDRDAAFAATTRLIEAGHRRLAYVTALNAEPPVFTGPDQLYTSSVKARIDGFLAACHAAGIESPERGVCLAGNVTAGQQRASVERLLSDAEPPTAILASDSLVAFEIFKATQARNLRIPDDLSLVSFYDAEWTSVTTPPISVIDQPVYDMGTQAAELLIARINGETPPARHCVLPTRFIERSSIGMPRSMMVTT